MTSVSRSAPMLRRAVADDVPVLRRIYADAVTAVGPQAYSPEQVQAWQAFADDPRFERFVLGVDTYVAQLHDEVVGFCGVSRAGHIASLYVEGAHAGRGLGSALLNEVLRLHPEPASGRYYAEASRFSLGLFLRAGFHEVARERVVHGGVEFEQIRVERAVRVP